MSSYFANYDNSDPPLKRHLSSVWNKKHLNLAQAGDHYRQTTRRDHHHQNSRPNAMLNLRTGANKVINRLFKRQTAYWNKYTLNNGHCKNSLLQNTCRHRSNFMDKNKKPGYEVIVHKGLSHGTQPTGVPGASIYIWRKAGQASLSSWVYYIITIISISVADRKLIFMFSFCLPVW